MKNLFRRYIEIIQIDRGCSDNELAEFLKMPVEKLDLWKVEMQESSMEEQISTLKKILTIPVQRTPKNQYGIFDERPEFIINIDEYKKKGIVDKENPAYKFIVNSLPSKTFSYFTEMFPKYSDYMHFYGSTGATKISSSMWCAYLDSRITTTTRRNSYVVTLFNNNCTRMYTCIAFGIEDIPKGCTPRKYLKEKVYNARMKIGKVANSMGFKIDDNVNLDAKSNRSKLYEKSIVTYKEHSVFEVTEEQFLEDLENMINLYYLYQFEYELDKEEGATYIQIDSQSKCKRRICTRKHQEIIKQQMQYNKLTGTKAEEYVLQKEKDNLRRNGREDLIDRIEWISNPKDGYDGLYDIHSFFPDGRNKRIEVKGTRLNVDADFRFYMSSNEIRVAESYPDEYVLVFVDNVGDSENIRIVDEISNPLDKIDKEAIQFRCTYSK